MTQPTNEEIASYITTDLAGKHDLTSKYYFANGLTDYLMDAEEKIKEALSKKDEEIKAYQLGNVAFQAIIDEKEKEIQSMKKESAQGLRGLLAETEMEIERLKAQAGPEHDSITDHYGKQVQALKEENKALRESYEKICEVQGVWAARAMQAEDELNNLCNKQARLDMPLDNQMALEMQWEQNTKLRTALKEAGEALKYLQSQPEGFQIARKVLSNPLIKEVMDDQSLRSLKSERREGGL